MAADRSGLGGGCSVCSQVRMPWMSWSGCSWQIVTGGVWNVGTASTPFACGSQRWKIATVSKAELRFAQGVDFAVRCGVGRGDAVAASVGEPFTETFRVFGQDPRVEFRRR